MYIFLLIFLLFSSLLAQSDGFEILSLKTYSMLDETSFPIINKRNLEKSQITIEFDVSGNYIPNLIIIFKLCDKNWVPYENIFLENPGYNTEYNLWLETLPTTVKNARYHYRDRFPNKNVTFPFSGQWQYFIAEAADPENIFASGRFYVVKPEIKLRTKLKRSSLEINSMPMEYTRTYSLSTSFQLPDSLVPSRVDFVKIIENQKIEYPIDINREIYGEYRYYNWNGSDQFDFVARDLRPGNEYRQTDFRDKNRFIPPVTKAQIDRVETTRYFKEGKRDRNGGYLLTNYKDEYAQYMDVVFELRPPEELKSSIFIVGSFTNWEVLPEYELQPYDHLFRIAIKLKRGVYDFQYVTGELEGDKVKNVDWYFLEGNFWSTKNDYRVFLFYNTPDNGGYNKIIGYIEISSGRI